MLAASQTPTPPALFVVVIVIGVVVVIACIAMLLNREKVNSFFKGAGTRLYGERIANRTYSAGRLVPVGIVGILIGVVFVVVGTMHLA